MNKSDLIDAISIATDLSKAAAERTLDTVIKTIVDALAKDGTVTLVGFGTFKTTHRSARTGKHPRTGEPLKIAARTVPRFIPGSEFKSNVAGKSAIPAKKL